MKRRTDECNQLGIAKASGSERHRFQEAEATARRQMGVPASDICLSRKWQVRKRRRADIGQLANPREPSNPGRLEGADYFTEPGLLHLLEPRFLVLSFTGKRLEASSPSH